MTKAESSAEELVFDLGLTLPIIPEDVCNELNNELFSVSYQEKSLSSQKFCGISVGDESGAKILINAAIENRGRKNFTAAHEIGHVMMHIQTGKQSEFECTNNDLSGRENAKKLYEKEANEFASSLLMPKSLINKSILQNDLNWQLIQSIYNDCETSLEATARRVVRLSDEACALIIHKDGEMWTPIKSSSFPAFINKTSFPKNLNTSPDFVDKELPNVLEECDASDWLSDSKGIPNVVYYNSIRNDEYDRTMTLLVIPEIDEEDDEEWDEPRFGH